VFLYKQNRAEFTKVKRLGIEKEEGRTQKNSDVYGRSTDTPPSGWVLWRVRTGGGIDDDRSTLTGSRIARERYDAETRAPSLASPKGARVKIEATAVTTM
jgi:hypothetical protein